MLRKLTLSTLVLVLSLAAGPALACGGLVAPNGTISLVRTTTLAAYHDGIEHYVTSFAFVGGGGGEFGSIVPLPGVPTNVERGGDWTLQRLVREVAPPVPEAGVLRAAAGDAAVVLQEYEIDALDITVLEGGGFAVGRWAEDHGFSLSPDAPEVLEFYAERSPIFMAATFDAKRAAELGQREGDGTPIHVTIPTPNPWVPLRILSLGLAGLEPVEADVFLLTDERPAMLPRPGTRGFTLERSEAASKTLLDDLRSDSGMEWVPGSMWLSYLVVDTTAADLDYDLAVDASGAGQPSPRMAGLSASERLDRDARIAWMLAGGLAALAVTVLVLATRRALPA